jgi:hypothetical protein
VTAERLPGGNLGGAVRVGDTVRRRVGPWTQSVAALLRHLEDKSFLGAPRFLGIDDEEREVLTFIEGETVGDSTAWPRWVYDPQTLDQVADWLLEFHEAVADFVPPADAVWRFGQPWVDRLIVGHNDAAPYNAVWRDGLVEAVQAQARKAPLPVDVEAAGDIGRQPQELEAAVYFCVLEALQNIAKYASASQVRVRLVAAGGVLTFDVNDDGAGFDTSATSYGTGLQGMTDRLGALGGDLTVTSTPGEGTTVTGRVPWNMAGD